MVSPLSLASDLATNSSAKEIYKNNAKNIKEVKQKTKNVLGFFLCYNLSLLQRKKEIPQMCWLGAECWGVGCCGMCIAVVPLIAVVALRALGVLHQHYILVSSWCCIVLV